MASIHDLVTATLSELGLTAPTDIIQTLLMKDNRFVGWKFRYDGGYAIQQAASKSIGLYDDEGRRLKVVAIETGQGAAA
jgi:hypothetical protein